MLRWYAKADKMIRSVIQVPVVSKKGILIHFLMLTNVGLYILHIFSILSSAINVRVLQVQSILQFD